MLHAQVWPSTENREKYITFLKTLIPYWKPSKSQMYSLACVISAPENDFIRQKSLQSLYNDLKALCELQSIE